MTNPCNLPTKHPETGGTSNFDVHVDVPKRIDPDTGTTETWKSYYGGWRSIDQRILQALRTRLTRNGMPPWSWDTVMEWARDILNWATVYMNAQYPGSDRIGCLPCETPQGRGTYQFTGLDLHELWRREKPLWYEDGWDNTPELSALWAEYDEKYADAVARGIILIDQ